MTTKTQIKPEVEAERYTEVFVMLRPKKVITKKAEEELAQSAWRYVYFEPVAEMHWNRKHDEPAETYTFGVPVARRGVYRVLLDHETHTAMVKQRLDPYARRREHRRPQHAHTVQPSERDEYGRPTKWPKMKGVDDPGSWSGEDALICFPQIVAHIISESSGYACPKTAANILADAMNGRCNWCEWCHACFDTNASLLVQTTIAKRQYHDNGFMSYMDRARVLTVLSQQEIYDPTFASWF